jgi:hypothetical protein
MPMSEVADIFREYGEGYRNNHRLPLHHLKVMDANLHAVFTIPQEVNALVLGNRKLMYVILFKAASETLLELGRDLRHLGGLLVR